MAFKLEYLKGAFAKRFKGNPIIVKSPGRINLIGEHTDYNEGFVLPATIDKAIYFLISPNDIEQFRFYSYNLNDYYETDTDNIGPSEKHWANYLLGVIAQFVKDGKSINGFDCVFGGDIPIGAGMSSSAAIECGLAYAINYIQKFDYSNLQLVKFSQKAEHEYAGVMCGIMDQFAIIHGQKNKAIKLDTRSLQYELFSIDLPEHKFVLVNTGVKHSLASSEYNKRRNECEIGVQIMKKYNAFINSLRDISLDEIQKHKKEFDEIVFDRCSYVIEENLRLEQACNALKTSNLFEFGRQMYGSHQGLKEKYDVSCKELDQLVDIAKNTNGVLGARMMGGVFGGCTINLISKNSIRNFKNAIFENYKTPDGNAPEIIEVNIGGGVQLIEEGII